MYVCDYKLIMRNARASSPAVQSFLYQFCRLMDPVVNVPIDGLVNNQYKSKTLPPCISLLSRSLSSDRYPPLQLNGRQTELFMPLSPDGGDVEQGYYIIVLKIYRKAILSTKKTLLLQMYKEY